MRNPARAKCEVSDLPGVFTATAETAATVKRKHYG